MGNFIGLIHTYDHEITYFCVGALVVISAILIYKLTVMQKQLQTIIRDVKKYLLCTLEEREQQENEIHRTELQKEQKEKRDREEQQNRLITAVLEEIFP